MKPALAALEALGPAIDDHLHMLLPALMRLLHPGAPTPLDIKRAALKSLRRLLPRMPLAGCPSAVLHPLIRVLDGASEELRRDALDTICVTGVMLGPEFAIFVPTLHKVNGRKEIQIAHYPQALPLPHYD